MRLLLLALGGALSLGCHFDKLLNATGGHHVAAAAEPPGAVAFTTEPQTAKLNSAITPPVQVSVEDPGGHVLPSFTGRVHVTLGRDGSLLGGAHLSGDTVVAAVNGVATFANLRIDQLGTGYTLVAALDGGTPSVVSASFDIQP